jgi:glucose-6-phosphate isomerase
VKNRLYFSANGDREEIFNRIILEQESIGYYTLPNQNIDEVLDFVEDFSEDIQTIAVLGIGGSSLGAKAVYEFLKPVQKFKRELLFFESTDPLNIAHLLNGIDISKTHFLVTSKSGGTVETISIFKYIYAQTSHNKNFTFITDIDSKLDRFAKKIGSKVFYLPPNVGGRFSVLSIVGLLPLALSGVDIQALLNGAKRINSQFFKGKKLNSRLIDKAIFYAKNSERYSINCLFAYSESLKYFTEWYVQLWGESLGKRQKHSLCNVGLTPVGLIGSKDQHSFLQLIMEGKRDKTVTFIKIKEFNSKLKIPDVTMPHMEDLDIINGIEFAKLINMQCNSVKEALLNEGEIPIDEIVISEVSAKSIGELIYYYELLTSLVGQLLDVNTYIQDGVEAGKIILKEKLKFQKKFLKNSKIELA